MHHHSNIKLTIMNCTHNSLVSLVMRHFILLVTGLGGTCGEWPWQPSLDTLLNGLFGVVVVVVEVVAMRDFPILKIL
jgi:hypothetical protein